jgi:hypothetical protein
MGTSRRRRPDRHSPWPTSTASCARWVTSDAWPRTLISGETIRADGESAFVTLFGITQGYDEVVVRTIARGQAISANDIATGRRVVVLGAGVAERLFAGVDPIGRTVTLGGIRFRVSGVLEAVGGSLFGPDRDQQVMVPVTVAQRMFGTDRVDAIFVRATTTAGTRRGGAGRTSAVPPGFVGRLDPDTGRDHRDRRRHPGDC